MTATPLASYSWDWEYLQQVMVPSPYMPANSDAVKHNLRGAPVSILRGVVLYTVRSQCGRRLLLPPPAQV